MQMTNTFEAQRYGDNLKARLHDLPVMGDAFAGPAYGQFEKSKGVGMIIGIVASVVTMGAALPMLASTVLATQIAGGVMLAGGALSGIGAVTGNKKLSKIGGVMSLAGGLGALASGGLTAAGAGGAFAEGSGSTAVQNFAGSMMESINSVGGAVGYGDIYKADAVTAAKNAGAASQAGDVATVPSPEAPQIGVDTAQPATVADAGAAPELKLTDPNAGVGAESGGTWNAGQQAPESGGIVAKNTVTPATNPPIDPANISNGPPSTPGIVTGEQPKGILGQASTWAKENSELLKTTMSAVEKGVGMSMSPDQQSELDAKAALYGAQASMLTTQQQVLEYQKNNMSKQVAMISADDPDLDNKVKTAAGRGVPVVFIPAIGTGGIKQTGGAWNAGTTNMAPQTPVRQATFAAQPAKA